MRKNIILLPLTLSLSFIGQAQFDTLYIDLQPSANEVLPTLMAQGDEYWCFGKAYIGQDDHFRIKKVNGQGEVLEVIDSTAYAPSISIFGGAIATSDDGFLLASAFGESNGTIIGKTIKFNNDLSIAWSNVEDSISSDTTDYVLDFAAEISDKAFIVSGWYRWTDPEDSFNTLHGQAIMKIDSLGNTVWVHTDFPGEALYYTIYSQELIELDNGELIHLRWYNTAGVNQSYIELQRLSADGLVIENRIWDEAYHYGAPDCIIKDGFLYMIYGLHEGELGLFDTFQTEFHFKKINLATWQEEWDVPMAIEALDDIHHLTMVVDFYELENGELVILGQGSIYYHYYYNIGFLVNFNLDGSVNWEKAFDPYPHNDPNIPVHSLEDMIVCPDDGYMITGYIDEFMIQSQKQHLIKTDACGDVVFSGCGVGVNEFFKTATSIAIYPNPAHSQLTLSLTNNSNATTISVFDMQGKLLLQESTRPNLENKTLDISELPSGMYMLQVMDELGNQNTVKWVKD